MSRPVAGSAESVVRRRLASCVLLASVGAALLITPSLTLSAVARIRSHSNLSTAQKASWGAAVSHIDPDAFAEAKAIIPSRATYYVSVAPSLSSFARLSFVTWASGTSLPRIAVDDPRQAAWIISWGRVPRLRGIAVDDIRRLRSAPRGVPVFVGRIRRLD